MKIVDEIYLSFEPGSDFLTQAMCEESICQLPLRLTRQPGEGRIGIDRHVECQFMIVRMERVKIELETI